MSFRRLIAKRKLAAGPFQSYVAAKATLKVFLQKDLKNKNNSVGAEPTTNNHLSDSRLPKCHQMATSWDPTTALQRASVRLYR